MSGMHSEKRMPSTNKRVSCCEVFPQRELYTYTKILHAIGRIDTFLHIPFASYFNQILHREAKTKARNMLSFVTRIASCGNFCIKFETYLQTKIQSNDFSIDNMVLLVTGRITLWNMNNSPQASREYLDSMSINSL